MLCLCSFEEENEHLFSIMISCMIFLQHLHMQNLPVYIFKAEKSHYDFQNWWALKGLSWPARSPAPVTRPRTELFIWLKLEKLTLSKSPHWFFWSEPNIGINQCIMSFNFLTLTHSTLKINLLNLNTKLFLFS